MREVYANVSQSLKNMNIKPSYLVSFLFFVALNLVAEELCYEPDTTEDKQDGPSGQCVVNNAGECQGQSNILYYTVTKCGHENFDSGVFKDCQTTQGPWSADWWVAPCEWALNCNYGDHVYVTTGVIFKPGTTGANSSQECGGDI